MFFLRNNRHIYTHHLVLCLGHNMSQTDANSTGGESGRGGHSGHTGTGCYKNHDHSMAHAGAPGTLSVNRPTGHQRRGSAVATTSGAVSIAAVTALLTSSPATNVSGQPILQPANNLVDLGRKCCVEEHLNEQSTDSLFGLQKTKLIHPFRIVFQVIRRVPERDSYLLVISNIIRLQPSVRQCQEKWTTDGAVITVTDQKWLAPT